MKDQDIKEVIKERYGKIARGEVKFCCPSCGPTVTDQCLAVGYTAEDLQLVPELAVLGVGCGNPTALADLTEGETVLDLGSGAGIDVFLAAKKVGEGGRVIGVDMTEDMVARGQQLAREHRFDNVEFRAGGADCLAGAMPKNACLEPIRRAGFASVTVVSESAYETPGMEARLQGKI